MKRIILLATLCFVGVGAHAQNFKQQQASQEKTIKACQRKHTITDEEYEKLMKEQRAIKKAIEKADEDQVYTDKEKDKISKMLEHSANRLTRYKTNGDEY
jgi:septal ring factor EnvC (AmiA/AmiB activator)